MGTLKHLTSRLKFQFYLCLMANNKLIKTLRSLSENRALVVRVRKRLLGNDKTIYKYKKSYTYPVINYALNYEDLLMSLHQYIEYM